MDGHLRLDAVALGLRRVGEAGACSSACARSGGTADPRRGTRPPDRGFQPGLRRTRRVGASGRGDAWRRARFRPATRYAPPASRQGGPVVRLPFPDTRYPGVDCPTGRRSGDRLPAADPRSGGSRAALHRPIRFRGLEREGETLVPRVENIRDAYANRLAAQQEAIRSLCMAAGFGFAIHRTDQPAETALLGLFTSLSDR